MGNDNNGQPQERVEEDGKALGGEPPNASGSEQQLIKEETEGDNNREDSVRTRAGIPFLIDGLIAVFEGLLAPL